MRKPECSTNLAAMSRQTECETVDLRRCEWSECGTHGQIFDLTGGKQRSESRACDNGNVEFSLQKRAVAFNARWVS